MRTTADFRAFLILNFPHLFNQSTLEYVGRKLQEYEQLPKYSKLMTAQQAAFYFLVALRFQCQHMELKEKGIENALKAMEKEGSTLHFLTNLFSDVLATVDLHHLNINISTFQALATYQDGKEEQYNGTDPKAAEVLFKKGLQAVLTRKDVIGINQFFAKG